MITTPAAGLAADPATGGTEADPRADPAAPTAAEQPSTSGIMDTPLAEWLDELATRVARLEAERQILTGRITDLEATRKVLEPPALPEDPHPAHSENPEAVAAAESARVKALAAHDQTVALQAEMESELLNARERLATNRRSLAETESALLTAKALEAWFAGAPGASRKYLEELIEPRRELRERVLELEALGATLDRFAERAGIAAARAGDGDLIGFAVDRERAARELMDLSQAAIARRRQLSERAVALQRQADEQEEEGRALYASLIEWASHEDRDGLLDRTFAQTVRTQRELQKRERAERSGVSIGELIDRVNGVLEAPSDLTTVREAQDEVAHGREALGAAERVLTSADVGDLAWRIDFLRRRASGLSGLATEATRRKVFSFSTAIVDDLSIEVRDAAGGLETWARGRWVEVSPFEASLPWQAWLQLLLAVLALTLGVRLRKRAGAMVTRVVARLGRLSVMSGRVGILVRWGTLGAAVAPTISMVLAAYASLFILGWDRPETQYLRVVAGWLVLYALGGATIGGLTQSATRSRPALIPMAPGVSLKLRGTYRWLGLVVAAAMILSELAARWVGLGRLHTLVNAFVLFWVGVWSIWAAFGWRTILADAWGTLAADGGREEGLAQRMAGSRLGAAFSPIALVRVLGHWTWRAGRALLARGGVLAYVRSRILARMARKADDHAPELRDELPESYVREFPLFPALAEGEILLLQDDEVLAEIEGQIEEWRSDGNEGSVLLVGEKGSGKTTLLRQLARRVKDLETYDIALQRRTVTSAVLCEALAPQLDVADAQDIDGLIEALNTGPERIIFADEMHNIFLRTINGYDGFHGLVRLVNQTSKRVFWIMAFNSFSWEFLSQSRRRARFFRSVIRMRPWTASDVQDLINRRNHRCGFQVEFDDMLLDRAGDDLQLVDSADGYFRTLAESAAGNPRIASYLWLNSLHVVGERSLRATLFREPALAEAGDLTGNLLFTLAAVCQHENLSADDLRVVLHTNLDEATFSLQALEEMDVLERKLNATERFTLSPRYYRQTLRLLRAKHLLFEKK